MDWWSLGFQAVNFLVLIGLLQRVLYRPVLAAIDRRRAAISEQAAQAALATRKAQDSEAQWQARLEGIEAERQEIRRVAAEAARRHQEAILAQAAIDAEALIAQGRARMAAERVTIGLELRREAGRVAIELASRLLGQTAPAIGVAPFLERAIAHLEAMPLAERQFLAESGAVTVELHPPLNPTAQAECIERLEALLEGATFVFEDQPGLIAGIRLCFETTRIDVSWAGALKVAEGEMQADAKPAR